MQCDTCQRRKDGSEFRAPQGDPEEPTEPFQITSVDITGQYPITRSGNDTY
jgi:hypothetical protein